MPITGRIRPDGLDPKNNSDIWSQKFPRKTALLSSTGGFLDPVFHQKEETLKIIPSFGDLFLDTFQAMF